jgi:hypothetical protein
MRCKRELQRSQEILRKLTLRGKEIAKSTTNTRRILRGNKFTKLKEYTEHRGDYIPHSTRKTAIDCNYASTKPSYKDQDQVWNVAEDRLSRPITPMSPPMPPHCSKVLSLWPEIFERSIFGIRELQSVRPPPSECQQPQSGHPFMYCSDFYMYRNQTFVYCHSRFICIVSYTRLSLVTTNKDVVTIYWLYSN